MKPGILITAYAPGIHRVISVSEYGVQTPDNYQIKYEPVLDSKLNPAKKMVKTCDMHWCAPVDEEYYQSVITSHESQLKALRKALDENKEVQEPNGN